MEDAGDGPAVLLLHGGAGPASMRPLLGALNGHRTLLSTIPGYDGTPHPDWLRSVPDIAAAYLALLDALGIEGVMAVGNSVCGWIGAEMAARRPSRLAGLVLIDAVGLEPAAETGDILNSLTFPPEERAHWSIHDPARFAPSSTPEALDRMGANARVLDVYAGASFVHDRDMARRLPQIERLDAVAAAIRALGRPGTVPRLGAAVAAPTPLIHDVGEIVHGLATGGPGRELIPDSPLGRVAAREEKRTPSGSEPSTGSQVGAGRMRAHAGSGGLAARPKGRANSLWA